MTADSAGGGWRRDGGGAAGCPVSFLMDSIAGYLFIYLSNKKIHGVVNNTRISMLF